MTSISSKPLVLRGSVISHDGVFHGSIDGLPLFSHGETLEEAESKLVRKLRSWAEEREEKGMLEKALMDAGFENVNENTEIVLALNCADDDNELQL